jgi:hypothetical protein
MINSKLNSNNEKKATIDGRSHGFNVGIAIDYSVTMALWIGYLAFWTEQNLSNNKHIHDSLCWSYDTLESLRLKFPYMSKSQIETMINNSITAGLVVKGNYNKTTYDRTCWYALTPKSYVYFQHLVTDLYLNRLYLSISEKSEMDFLEFGNLFPRNRTPIPDTKPNIKTNTTTTGDGQKPNRKTPEPVVVITESLKTQTQKTEQLVSCSDLELVPGVDIPAVFISKEVDRRLTDAYNQRPVKSKNIDCLESFLSACKYAIEHRAPEISEMGRIKGIINFVHAGTFDEPEDWAKEIVKKRNARIAEINLKKAEIATERHFKETFKQMKIKDGSRDGLRSLATKLKEEENKKPSYAEKKQTFRPYKTPEQLNC